MAEVEEKKLDEKTTRTNNGKRPRKNNFDKKPIKEDEFEQRMIDVRLVQKTTSGGRTPSFSALCVVGDKKGRVGIGTGKARETVAAIEKGFNEARKNLITVAMNGTTIPHDIEVKYGASKVKLLPAKPGTGVIAGGASRAVLELAGIKDITAKKHGSNNKINIVRATYIALKSLRTASTVAEMRGKKEEEL